MDWADLILDWLVRIAWPLLAAVVLWKLFPTLREVLSTRAFRVKVAGAEISVQRASDQVSQRLADIQEQVVALERRLDEGGGGDGSIGSESPGVPDPAVGPDAATAGLRDEGPLEPIRRLLWVDDHPANNAYNVESFRKRGYEVEQARSTDEAVLRLADADAVITDLGREESGGFRPDAGLELLRRVKATRPELPVYVYTSPDAAAARAEQLTEAGASGVTASGAELAALVSRESGRRFERAVRRAAENAGAVVETASARGLDFVARVNDRQLGLDAKFWASGAPSVAELAGIVARRVGVAERLRLDAVIVVVPAGTALVDRYASGDVRVRTLDDLSIEFSAPPRPA